MMEQRLVLLVLGLLVLQTASPVIQALSVLPETQNEILEAKNEVLETQNEILEAKNEVQEVKKEVPEANNDIPDAMNELEDMTDELDIGNKAWGASPRWPTTCGRTRYIDRRAKAGAYYSTMKLKFESTCWYDCKRDEECGMYMWRERTNKCWKYHHSTKMWDRAGIPWKWILRSVTRFNVGSKNCEVSINGVGTNTYPAEESRNRKSPHDKYIITWIQTPVAKDLSEGKCFRMCNKYTECSSVLYRKDSSYYRCYFYSITITELLEQGLTSQVITNTNNKEFPIYRTFERFVNGKPYRPGKVVATTTVKPPTPTTTVAVTTVKPPEPTTHDTGCPAVPVDDYIHCLPDLPGGLITEDLCDQLDGCCFYDLGGGGQDLCVRPP